MNNNFLRILTFSILILFSVSLSAQVTIGVHALPSAGSLLDLKENVNGTSTKGLMLPRVTLLSSASLQPCANENEGQNSTMHTGLIVYNTAAVNDMCPGVYVWSDGKWQRVNGACTTRLIPYYSSLTLSAGYGGEWLDARIMPKPSVPPTLRWSSDNPAVASIDENSDSVIANAVGTATISVTYGDGSVSASFVVTVVEPHFGYKHRLILKDKGTSPFSINNPLAFLSQKSLDRRTRQGIVVDETDLPISDDYIRAIEATGAKVVAKSKWMKTVSVQCWDESMIEVLKTLPFVEKTQVIGYSNISTTMTPRASGNGARKWGEVEMKKHEQTHAYGTYDAYYGRAAAHIDMNNGRALHDVGYKGAGIDIAVVDAGYADMYKVDIMNNIRIKESKSFIYGDPHVYGNTHYHGLEVISCMATNAPGQYVGTAPEANYWVFRTEDIDNGEYPISEDYQITALEYADSVGVDVVNASLAYDTFTAPAISYVYADTDGQTALLSRSVNMAVDKGMFYVCGAGNDGGTSEPWVGIPSDAPNALAVGALEPNSEIAGFSSRGYTADGRIKPDVVALGAFGVTVISGNLPDGEVSMDRADGTSFSSPIMCGLAACLWQAYPTLTSKELLQVIKESGDKATSPDAVYGWGKPDMQKAMLLARQVTEAKMMRESYMLLSGNSTYCEVG